MLEPIWSEILTHIVGFVILLVLLKKYLWGPMLGALDARRAHIKTSLDDVDQAKADIERLRSEYETRMAEVDDAARQKMREATTDGKRIANEIQEAARTESRRLVEEMKSKLDLEVAQARIEFRDRVAALAIGATERLLHERLDATKDQALVEGFLAELEEQHT
jgi:F-type H+-transporting ATPase subunit b